MMRVCCLMLLVVMVWPAAAAPELSEDQRDLLVDVTTDRDALLDQEPGFYVLLRNASGWMGDDFVGDAGAELAPQRDLSFIKKNPAKARGEVYLLEGWVKQHDRYPSQADGLGRDELLRAGDPAWGEQVTRWTVVTQTGEKASTVIVILNDPRGQIADPGDGKKVRVAARFYKLWTIKDVDGKPTTYPVFIGGATEKVSASGFLDEGSGPPKSLYVAALVAVAGAFFVLRFLMGKVNDKGRQRTGALVEARRRLREEDAGDEDDQAIEDLPEDPVAALDILRDRHGSD